MSISKRRQAIFDYVSERRSCSYQELAELLNVSSMTIRRDVDLLVSEGGLIKTLSGIHKVGETELYETDLRERMAQNCQEKRQIARAAAELISDSATIFIDGGSTSLELARAIPDRLSGLTVVTNSFFVSLELGKKRQQSVILGGQYDPPSGSIVGPSAEEAASKVFPDFAFLSTKGFIVGEGSFESSSATFRIKQIIAANAAKVVLLIDHSKFGRRALRKVLETAQIHAVVTDDEAPQADLDALRDAGKQVIVAEFGRPIHQTA